MSTTSKYTPKIILIVGQEARELVQHVNAYVKPDTHWREVQVTENCGHGCKLYVRRTGTAPSAPLQFQVYHSTTYGCALGRAEATRHTDVIVDAETSDVELGRVDDSPTGEYGNDF